VSTQDDLVEVFALEESDDVVDVRAVAACRLIMHHADGHTEETEVRGNGPMRPARSSSWGRTGVISVTGPAHGRRPLPEPRDRRRISLLWLSAA
jgi:hypothetical protein